MSLRPVSLATTAAAGIGGESGEHLDGALLERARGRVGRHLDVRFDTHTVERTAGRREVVPNGQLQRRPVGQLARCLHTALAERARADQDGPTSVLQCRRDDLCRARGAAVDEYDEWQACVAVAERAK